MKRLMVSHAIFPSSRLALAVMVTIAAVGLHAEEKDNIHSMQPLRSKIIEETAVTPGIELQPLPSNIQPAHEMSPPAPPPVSESSPTAPAATAPAPMATPRTPAFTPPTRSAAPVLKTSPRPPTLVVQPDEAGLWEMLNRGQYELLEMSLEQLRQRHPTWDPPPQLLQLAREGRIRRDVTIAIENRDSTTLARLGEAHPEFFSCEHIDWAWALAEAHAALGRPEQAYSVLQKLVPTCHKEEDRLATLYKARSLVGEAAWEALLEAERPAMRSPEGEAAYQRLRYEHALEKLMAAYQDKDMLQVEARFSALTPKILAYRDVGAALVGAWHYYQREDCASATQWFARVLEWDATRHEARRGTALCQIRQGDYAGALATAQALPAEDPERSRLLRDARLGQSQSAYAAQDYAAALSYLEEAAGHGELPRHAQITRGWSLFHLGRAQEASEIFGRLYREQPDIQSAEGVLNSLVKANRLDELDILAGSEPLAGMTKAYYAQKWFDQKHFLAARDKFPEKFAEFGAIGAPRVTLLGGHREKSGQTGASRLTQDVTGMEAAWPVTLASEIRLKLEHVRLDNGTYDTGGWQPTLEWQQESADTTYKLQVGLTPIGGPVDPRLVGEASMRHSTPWGEYKMAAYMRPVKESILSYVGEDEPVEHGRVVRNGGEMSAMRFFEEGWGISGKIALEYLTGRRVQDNTHLALDGSISRNLKPEGFDYLSISLGAGYDRYTRNLSQFTLGHGGYFSPQTYWRWGPALDFMTAENQQALVKGRLSVGGFYKKEDGVGSRTGPTYNADIHGVWRLGDHVQLGASLVKRYAPDYRDFTGLAFLRILFEPRKTVLSSDLPAAISESIY
ncbi:MAG: cellulose synthase subunit BcsC-related outer membrane protein [Methylophilaceae bacterium]|nr:cellulose synthase subunit BcsC-related outer membrane protein [Methylophilaceae bacterium]